jgi:hypothetical protein
MAISKNIIYNKIYTVCRPGKKIAAGTATKIYVRSNL